MFSAGVGDAEGQRRSVRRARCAARAGAGEPIELPPDALKTLHEVVHGLASGTEPMLTTTEAADFLGVSRPFLTRLLTAGRIPYRKKGNRHLVPAGALRESKARRDEQLDRRDRLAAAEEDLGPR